MLSLPLASLCPRNSNLSRLGSGELTELQTTERGNFPGTMRVRCEPAARGVGVGGTTPSQRRPSPPALLELQSEMVFALFFQVRSAIALDHPHTRTRLRPRSHTLIHARKRVAAARSATLSGAPSGARLPPVVVGRRPRLPAVLSNGPGSRIGPAAGTTPARLLHSSDTRASRDI